MGMYRHEAIIVYGSIDKARILAAWYEAVLIFRGESLTPIIEGAYNNMYSFMVGPDGSKLGWPGQEELEAKRLQFVNWLLAHNISYTYVILYDDFGIPRIKDV
jgi:hypothetical protein